LLRTINLLPAKVDAGPLFTATALVPVEGARGTTKLLGAFRTKGCEYVFHAPPACHAQPWPGKNTQVP
jgi:hypothetical protein